MNQKRIKNDTVIVMLLTLVNYFNFLTLKALLFNLMFKKTIFLSVNTTMFCIKSTKINQKFLFQKYNSPFIQLKNAIV